MIKGSGSTQGVYAKRVDGVIGHYGVDGVIGHYGVVASRAGAKVYYVSVVNGKIFEHVLEPELIS